MTTKVNVPPPFLSKLKRLERKYQAVSTEVDNLIARLESDERPGDKIPSVGYDVYKVRLKNPSAGKGKSGGFRVIYYIQLADQVILLTIYSKSQQSDISAEQLRRIIEEYIPPDASE
ncbi:MAG: type II toxin-antitoxin system RelE/ParE family toxin [Burkholderiales bacterium]|nr:type II toxin-antitoxin system RelE/ParE family toxin [Anaerolineae bacterium]